MKDFKFRKNNKGKETATLIQFVKFAIVGVSNTLLTALVIYVALKLLNCSDFLSNIAGYTAGLANSFIWNRKWTFASKLSIKNTLLKFILTFAMSYAVQLGNLFLWLRYTSVDPYVCQLISMVIYTGINFTLNKLYTFKAHKQ